MIKPRSRETLSDWVTRCMDDAGIQEAYPQEAMRKEYCISLWNASVADSLEFSETKQITQEIVIALTWPA